MRHLQCDLGHVTSHELGLGRIRYKLKYQFGESNQTSSNHSPPILHARRLPQLPSDLAKYTRTATKCVFSKAIEFIWNILHLKQPLSEQVVHVGFCFWTWSLCFDHRNPISLLQKHFSTFCCALCRWKQRFRAELSSLLFRERFEVWLIRALYSVLCFTIHYNPKDLSILDQLAVNFDQKSQSNWSSRSVGQACFKWSILRSELDNNEGDYIKNLLRGGGVRSNIGVNRKRWGLRT